MESLKNIKISKLDISSWFSILWTPVKSSKGVMMNTSFLSYYQFNINDQNNLSSYRVNKHYSEIPIIGILPIKFDSKLFLSRINKQIPMSGMNLNIMNLNMMHYKQNPIYNEQHSAMLKGSIVILIIFKIIFRIMFIIMLY